MAYRALYREYRPRTFSDMVGQDHITSVLKNQIKTGKTAHAYLLCGTRGTGKTTAARIIARAINCLEPVDGEPCGHCEACRFSHAENCPDIVEMDAASNTGVDNIRELLEDIYLSPLKLKKRVFIIDEVHMLSAGAFNALLKTLEEPPEHLVFILATTEAHKLLPTIVSRCQRFDFHRISIQNIVSYLKHVVSSVGAASTDEGLQTIARAANGGMRDALSLLDQCLSFCGDNLTEDSVRDVLGSMGEQYLFEVSDALLDYDTPSALRKLSEIVESGRDYNVFLSDLVAHFRALTLVKQCGECPDLIECPQSTMRQYLTQTSKTGSAHLLYTLQLLLEAQSQLRYAHSPRAYLESILIRVTKPALSETASAIEARLEKAEHELEKLSKLLEANPDISSGSFIPAQSVNISGTPAPVSKEDAPKAFNNTANSTQDPKPYQGAARSQTVPDESSAAVSRAVQPTATEKTSDSVASQCSAPESDDAQTLWSKLLKETLRANPLQYSLIQNGVALKLENNVLTVGFSTADHPKFAIVSAPKSIARLSETLGKFRASTTISVTEYTPSKADPETESKLKEMFGDTLVIDND